MTSLAGRVRGWTAAGAVLLAPLAGQDVAVPKPPAVFERILWCSDPARGSALARRLGYSAVQLGRGGDPAPVLQAGLGYYLDQPIGKGLLELRDEQWQPVQQAYETTRDAAALRRPGCFLTPGLLARATAEAAAEAVRVRGLGLRFVALADEPSATRHDAPLDTCRCEHCLQAFRTFLAARLGTIDAANAALGTHAASFEQLVPPSTDQVRRRELGDTALPTDLRAFGLWLEFVDGQYAQAVTTIAAAVQAAVPGVPVGLTGLGAPAAFGGNDQARYVPALTLLEPYPIGGAVELARCLAPLHAHLYATLAPPSPAALGDVPLASYVRARLAAMACGGLAGVVVWNDGTVATPAGELTPFGAAVDAAARQLAPALHACAGARLEPSPVWIVESQPSVRAWWMLDSVGDGMTWVRRLASYESTHSTSQNARVGWLQLLQDLGLQPQFVAEATMPERLLRQRPRCVVLPATVALADRTVQALTAYVRAGGVLLADHSTALYDETLLRRPGGALDGLFGIESRSLRWDDLWVKEGRATSRERGLPLAEAALRGATAERREAGDAHVELATGRGRAVYLNAPVAAYPAWRLAKDAVDAARELRRRVRSILHEAGVEPPCEVRGAGLPTLIERTRLRLRDGREVLAIRVHALDDPTILQRLATDGSRPVRVELPVAQRLRPLGGDELPSATSFDLRLDPFGALWLEVLR